MGKLSASIVLTVADHEQNGFVALAAWRGMALSEAHEHIAGIDASIDDEMEPDIDTAPFTFILDLWEGDDCIDSGARLLPTQIAMSLAPEQVRGWLDSRPEPDSLLFEPIPVRAQFPAGRTALSEAKKDAGR